MNYVILAAGIGRAMQKYGPKIMMRVGSRPLLDKTFSTIYNFDKNARIYLVTGFGHDEVLSHILCKKYDCAVIKNELYRTTGQSESLRIGLNATFNDDTYIIHGDIIFNKTCLLFRETSILLSDKMPDDSVGVCHTNGELRNISFGLGDKWSQIAFISKDHYFTLLNTINSFKTNKMTYEFINLLSETISFRVIKDKRKNSEELSK